MEVVWSVLIELSLWQEWSTWMRYEGGEVALGEKLLLRLTPPGGGGWAFSPEIIALEPPRRFGWGRTGLPGVFDGEHHFELEPLDGGSGTRLINRERYSGVLSPLSKRLL